MGVMDILKQYVDRPTGTQQDFDDVAREVPAAALGGGIADAFRSDKTADFGQLAASLFGGSNGQQQAGLIGQLIKSAECVLRSLADQAIHRRKLAR